MRGDRVCAMKNGEGKDEDDDGKKCEEDDDG